MDEDKTLVIIDIFDGEKCICYSGYGYFAGEPEDKPYRWVDYTFFICPLSDAIAYGIKEYETDCQDSIKQYVSDLTETEYNAIINAKPYTILNAENVTQDIACGTYWI